MKDKPLKVIAIQLYIRNKFREIKPREKKTSIRYIRLKDSLLLRVLVLAHEHVHYALLLFSVLSLVLESYQHSIILISPSLLTWALLESGIPIRVRSSF